MRSNWFLVQWCTLDLTGDCRAPPHDRTWFPLSRPRQTVPFPLSNLPLSFIRSVFDLCPEESANRSVAHQKRGDDWGMAYGKEDSPVGGWV
mmetsp:Transcript_23779/g.46720  ORF Transcript_23779/g.46720 Transcript_23779/m.46720 type:complete len:91 (-) Transcript_23779:225-497(-)